MCKIICIATETNTYYTLGISWMALVLVVVVVVVVVVVKL